MSIYNTRTVYCQCDEVDEPKADSKICDCKSKEDSKENETGKGKICECNPQKKVICKSPKTEVQPSETYIPPPTPLTYAAPPPPPPPIQKPPEHKEMKDCCSCEASAKQKEKEREDREMAEKDKKERMKYEKEQRQRMLKEQHRREKRERQDRERLAKEQRQREKRERKEKEKREKELKKARRCTYYALNPTFSRIACGQSQACNPCGSSFPPCGSPTVMSCVPTNPCQNMSRACLAREILSPFQKELCAAAPTDVCMNREVPSNFQRQPCLPPP
ncbi:DNA ligase 1-like [Aethina tumida]|uniref:DNA ligase 1-like n=1 Tax=Aethina tumida TaxID=116153 RepID=UPI0021494ACE|nr:DNA ligase 1-like [Aethina tumida]